MNDHEFVIARTDDGFLVLETALIGAKYWQAPSRGRIS